MNPLDHLRAQLAIVARAYTKAKTYKEHVLLGEKLDALVDEIERISPCDECGHMVVRCTCPF